MKQKEKLYLLKEECSPYFMGSSLSMMIYLFCDNLKENQYDMTSIKEASLKFFEDDVTAFTLTKSKYFDEASLINVIKIFTFLKKYSSSLYDFALYLHSHNQKEWALIFKAYENIEFMIEEDIVSIIEKNSDKEAKQKLQELLQKDKKKQSFEVLKSSFIEKPICNNRTAYIYASIPLIFTLIKLLNRKNNSKKPFSNDYKYKVYINILDFGIENLLNKKVRIKNSDLIEFYNKIILISSKAVNEINMVSLKKDYLCIADLIYECEFLINKER